MTEVERRLALLLAALADENRRLQALLASGGGLRWAERQLGTKRVLV